MVSSEINKKCGVNEDNEDLVLITRQGCPFSDESMKTLQENTVQMRYLECNASSKEEPCKKLDYLPALCSLSNEICADGGFNTCEELSQIVERINKSA